MVSLFIYLVWSAFSEDPGLKGPQGFDVNKRPMQQVHFDQAYEDGPGQAKAKGSTRPYAKGFQNTLAYTKELDSLHHELGQRREQLGFMETGILRTKEHLAQVGVIGTLIGAKRALQRRLEHDEGQYVERLHHFHARNELYGTTLKKRDEIYQGLLQHGQNRQTRLARLSQLALERGQEDASASFRMKKNEVHRDLESLKDFHAVTSKDHWSAFHGHKTFVESKSCGFSRSC